MDDKNNEKCVKINEDECDLFFEMAHQKASCQESAPRREGEKRYLLGNTGFKPEDSLTE